MDTEVYSFATRFHSADRAIPHAEQVASVLRDALDEDSISHQIWFEDENIYVSSDGSIIDWRQCARFCAAGIAGMLMIDNYDVTTFTLGKEIILVGVSLDPSYGNGHYVVSIHATSLEIRRHAR